MAALEDSLRARIGWVDGVVSPFALAGRNSNKILYTRLPSHTSPATGRLMGHYVDEHGVKKKSGIPEFWLKTTFYVIFNMRLGHLRFFAT